MTSTATSNAITTDTPVGTRVRVSEDATTTGGGYVDPVFKGTDTGTLDSPWRGSGDVVVRLEGHGVNYIGAQHVTIAEEEPAPAPLEHADRVGRLSIGITDSGRHVWFYVVAVLPGGKAYGVNLGTNSSLYTPDGDGLRFETVSLDGYTNDPLSRLSSAMLDELSSFLRQSSPVLASAVAGTSGESTEDAYARGKADQRREDVEEFDRWKARATEVAHEYADRNDLCGEFDRCMSDIGLPTRSREYRVTYTVRLPRDAGDPWSLDAEDLFSAAEEGAGSPTCVEEV